MVTLRSRSRPPIPSNKKQEPKTRPRRSSTSKLGIAVGLRFHPTEQEIVDYYLHNRIANGDEFQSDFIHDCADFFGQNEPWVVWDMYGGNECEDEQHSLYFFTRRKRLSPTAKRFDRKVGSGTWSGQHPRDIVADGLVIGIRREFRYEEGCDEKQNNAWLMQEYQTVDDDCDIVVCSLRKSPRKATPTSTARKRKTRINGKKGKAVLDQPKPKRRRREQSCVQEEEDDSSVDDEPNMEQPKMEQIDFEWDQDHPLLQEVSAPNQFQVDQDCYYPEFYPELYVDNNPDFSTVDELLGQTPTCYDSNNFNLVSSDNDHSGLEESSNFSPI
ncbi:NAC domain-containing protein 41-like [Argentina anserina]|uniref:NAC domain-containing protein 41-like n=1 Tax=Argentina anserina TaxID=57926 RepID=UPI0021767A59|nr:NAC domain-containing protein 41-like [Potentilla anserina]